MSENLPESVLESLGVKTGVLGQKIRDGKITLAEVVAILSPPEAEVVPAPSKPPLPVAITPKVAEALKQLPAVFGSVVPDERRILSDAELTKLLEERDTIDSIIKTLTERKEKSIRTTVLNHLDVALEDELSEQPERLAATDRDKEGHYYHSAKANVGDTGKAFSWEVQDGSSVLSPEKLKELDEAGEIDHKLYLEITTPVRVINEQKLLLAMGQQPEEVLATIKAASIPGSKKKGSLYVRNAS